MMYLLLTVIVLIAVVYWLTDTDSNDKIDTHGDDVYESPIEGTFDMSYFKTSEGKFNFPYYETGNDALVHIKDKSNYDKLRKDLMDNGVIQDGQIDVLPFNIFNMYIGSYLSFDVGDFWDFMEELSEDDLQPYSFLKYHIDNLQKLLCEIEDEGIDHVLFIKDDFMKELYANGFFYKYEDGNNTEFYKSYFSSLNLDQLKRLGQKYNLDLSESVFEVIEKLVDKASNEDLPLAVMVNDKFTEMIQYFYINYFSSIQNEIDDWHPVYIRNVWESVKDMVDALELESLKTIYNKVVETKYWKNRIQLTQRY